jgi:acetolactate synthase-1/2/3 large subunit
VGDAKNIIPKLDAEYRALDADGSRLDGWWQRIKGWQEKHPLGYEPGEDGEIKPQRMVEALYEATGGQAVVTSDVGQHQMWAAQYFHFDAPRNWINSGGAGTMGFGLPSAMGAKVARPEDQVICIAGDGSIIMNIQEMATCVTEQIPVKVFIMNNGYLGMVRQWQELFWDRRYSSVEMGASPDWVKLAEAFGAKGMLIEKEGDLVAGIKECLEHDGPVVCDIRVTAEENCYPMIPAGSAARDMVG